LLEDDLYHPHSLLHFSLSVTITIGYRSIYIDTDWCCLVVRFVVRLFSSSSFFPFFVVLFLLCFFQINIIKNKDPNSNNRMSFKENQWHYIFFLQSEHIIYPCERKDQNNVRSKSFRTTCLFIFHLLESTSNELKVIN
jgi:hypothetical protein